MVLVVRSKKIMSTRRDFPFDPDLFVGETNLLKGHRCWTRLHIDQKRGWLWVGRKPTRWSCAWESYFNSSDIYNNNSQVCKDKDNGLLSCSMHLLSEWNKPCTHLSLPKKPWKSIRLSRRPIFIHTMVLWIPTQNRSTTCVPTQDACWLLRSNVGMIYDKTGRYRLQHFITTPGSTIEM